MDSQTLQSEALAIPLPDPRLKAIGLMTISVFLINVMNAMVKLVSDIHPPLEILFYRGTIAMALLLVWALFRGKLKTIYKTARPWSHFGRGLFGNVGLLLVIWSFTLLPMADATATLFASTLMVTVLSALILKEQVGPWRWSAVIAGFIGVLMIVHPSGAMTSGYASFVPLAAAFFGAFVQIYLRELGKSEDALTTVFYFLLFGIVISSVYMPFKGQLPTLGTLLPLTAIALCGLVSLILKSYAFSLAEASLLSPFNYTAIVWATLLGWIFWGDMPTLAVTGGAAIIIASNLLIIYRERRR